MTQPPEQPPVPPGPNGNTSPSYGQTPPPPPPPPAGQPYQPYGSPNPYAPTPYPQQQKSGGGKTALIIVLSIVGVVLLLCGGIVAMIFWIGSSIEDTFDEFDGDRAGGPDNPIAVGEGEAFEIDGMTYQEGWSVGTDEFGDASIVGLVVENDRADETSEWVSIDFSFIQGSREIGEISCSSTGSIRYGNSQELDCYSMGTRLKDYDSIEVSAGY